MPEDAFYMADLLARSLEEELTAEERAIVDRWADSSKAKLELMSMVMDKRRFQQQFVKFIRIDTGRAWKKLLVRHPELQAGSAGAGNGVRAGRGDAVDGFRAGRGGAVDGRDAAGKGVRAGGTASAADGREGASAANGVRAEDGGRGERAANAADGREAANGQETAGLGQRANNGGQVGMGETAGFLRRTMRTMERTVPAIRSWLDSKWQIAGFVLGVGIFLYLGTYLVQIYRRFKLDGNLSYHHAHYTPAGHFAALLLADGSNYELASASAGNLQELGCVVFSKSSDSSMSMTLIPGCNNKHSENYPPVRQPANNTLSTRNGGYFSASLLDGSKVRLNAASSLHFPTMFAKTKREVYLEGEGFFDVAPSAMNNNAPFVVHVFVHPQGRADVLADTLTIVSLGTRFDVEAYPGEGGIRTRLQEGGLLLKSGDQQLSLSAGQTAILDDNGRLKLDNKTPADSTYWEKGQFLFVEEPATQILDELSRWYDVRFVYRVKKPQEPFTLKGFNRSAPLKDLLDELETMSDLRFQKGGDTVVYVLR